MYLRRKTIHFISETVLSLEFINECPQVPDPARVPRAGRALGERPPEVWPRRGRRSPLSALSHSAATVRGLALPSRASLGGREWPATNARFPSLEAFPLRTLSSQPAGYLRTARVSAGPGHCSAVLLHSRPCAQHPFFLRLVV